ncbi:hypothetical protein Godav_000711, partial [Gossypium davidsonii]|nr:hypothetical protein [Gossypium davidsonii]
QNESQVNDIIGPTFTRLRINTDSVDYRRLIHELFRFGRRISVWVHRSGTNCDVLPLRLKIQASVVEHYHDDEILMRTALAESASEFESRNYGMVPAKESLVNEMLKMIKVEDEDKKKFASYVWSNLKLERKLIGCLALIFFMVIALKSG